MGGMDEVACLSSRNSSHWNSGMAGNRDLSLTLLWLSFRNLWCSRTYSCERRNCLNHKLMLFQRRILKIDRLDRISKTWDIKKKKRVSERWRSAWEEKKSFVCPGGRWLGGWETCKDSLTRLLARWTLKLCRNSRLDETVVKLVSTSIPLALACFLLTSAQQFYEEIKIFVPTFHYRSVNKFMWTF